MPSNHNEKKRRGIRRATRRCWIAVALLLGLILLLNRNRFRPAAPAAPEPATPRATYDLAMQYLANYRVDDAERVLLAVLAEHPDSVRVRDELRWMYFNQFRQVELESLLEDGLRAEPGHFAFAVALLMSEFRPQNPREVLGYWQRAASRQPKQARVQATLGYCYARVGEMHEAEQAFQAALDLAPDDVLVRIRAVEFLVDGGNWSSVEQLLDGNFAEQADGSSQDFYRGEYWWSRSLLAESQGRFDAALADVEQSLAMRPDELRYVQRRGTLLQLLGRHEEAADWFEHANRLESQIGRLTEIVLSGSLENPTPELCREIAAICGQRGKTIQAASWNLAAAHVEKFRGS